MSSSKARDIPTVERIVIKVAGKELSLSPDEAKQLLGVLDGLLGKTGYPWYQPNIAPWPYPTYPVYPITTYGAGGYTYAANGANSIG